MPPPAEAKALGVRPARPSGGPQRLLPDGFADETGEGPGKGFNVNYPLPEEVDGEAYRPVLARALRRVALHRPAFLVVSLGLDPAKADPTATWSLTAPDFRRNGAMLAELRLPTLVVQEGGHRVRTLGINARSFFEGLWSLQGSSGKLPRAARSTREGA